MVAALLKARPEAAQVADEVRGGGSMGDSRPEDVCEKKGASKCVRGLAYSDMDTHPVYGTWVCFVVGVQIRVKCVWDCVFECLRVYACMCTHTPTQSDCYDLNLQPLAYLGRHMCVLYVCV